MKCVILQPSYLPWRGYFHQIYKADLFVFYDDAQYDKRGWRNRNRIKAASGLQWLTIPVISKGAMLNHTPINQIPIAWTRAWNEKHWLTIRHAYAKAPYFGRYAPLLESFYRRRPEWLADFTIETTIALAAELGITQTRFARTSTLGASGQKTERLINILQTVGATHYISGPSARAYIELEQFATAGITLEYMTYDYPDYPQLHGQFESQISILDLLLMTGPAAGQYIWES